MEKFRIKVLSTSGEEVELLSQLPTPSLLPTTPLPTSTAEAPHAQNPTATNGTDTHKESSASNASVVNRTQDVVESRSSAVPSSYTPPRTPLPRVGNAAPIAIERQTPPTQSVMQAVSHSATTARATDYALPTTQSPLTPESLSEAIVTAMQSVKVYVVESEISDAQRAVKAVVEQARF